MLSSVLLGDQKVVMKIDVGNCFKGRLLGVLVLDNHAQKRVFLYAVLQRLYE